LYIVLTETLRQLSGWFWLPLHDKEHGSITWYYILPDGVMYAYCSTKELRLHNMSSLYRNRY